MFQCTLNFTAHGLQTGTDDWLIVLIYMNCTVSFYAIAKLRHNSSLRPGKLVDFFFSKPSHCCHNFCKRRVVEWFVCLTIKSILKNKNKIKVCWPLNWFVVTLIIAEKDFYGLCKTVLSRPRFKGCNNLLVQLTIVHFLNLNNILI